MAVAVLIAAAALLAVLSEILVASIEPFIDSFGLSAFFVGVVIVLIAVNSMGALADILAQSLMQLSVPGHLRGRVGGAWVVAIGLGPLGQLQIGALASLFGVSVAWRVAAL